MLGKGVTLGDCMLVIAIVAPVGLATGAFLGYFGDRFGLSGGMRAVVIAAFVSVAGHFARVFVTRRIKARNTVQGRV